MFSPQRFMEQVMSFEYLFDKLEHQNAKNSRFSLKQELVYSFNLFPELLKNERLSVEDISDKIKEIRCTIVHGYMYYYDFKDNNEAKRLMLLLDSLIRNMSLCSSVTYAIPHFLIAIIAHRFHIENYTEMC